MADQISKTVLGLNLLPIVSGVDVGDILRDRGVPETSVNVYSDVKSKGYAALVGLKDAFQFISYVT
jgi:hypothetical protein